MEESEFRGFLEIFPVIRSRDYCADPESRESTSQSGQSELNEWKNAWDTMDHKQNIDNEDPFWQNLKSKAEMKVGSSEADKFCKAFQQVYKKLVYEEVNLDLARKFVGSADTKGLSFVRSFGKRFEESNSPKSETSVGLDAEIESSEA